MSHDTPIIQVRKQILRSALKAETTRIRHLKRLAAHHRHQSRIVEKTVWSNEHDDLSWRYRDAAVCPAERARCANIALGYLNGRSYRQIENKNRLPLANVVQSLAKEIASKTSVEAPVIMKWMLDQHVSKEGVRMEVKVGTPKERLRKAS